MARLRLVEGDMVYVTSRRGSIVMPVQSSTQVAPAQAFIAMHWGEEFVSGHSSTGHVSAGANALTTPAFCPRSKQPELKHSAVKIVKAELPWRLLAVAWLPENQAWQAREQLRDVMPQFIYAACVPFGRERTGLLFRAAAHEAALDETMSRIEQILGLAGTEVLRYADRRRGQRRSMRLRRHGADERLEGFLLAGDTSAEAWIKTLLQDELPAQAYGRLLLVPGAKAPLSVAARGRQVCSCFNVSEAEIGTALAQCEGAADTQLQQLQTALKCGTQCGSCVPELRRLVRLRLQVA
jgi:assimilatory nitrate reductase catalytic subunit